MRRNIDRCYSGNGRIMLSCKGPQWTLPITSYYKKHREKIEPISSAAGYNIFNRIAISLAVPDESRMYDIARGLNIIALMSNNLLLEGCCLASHDHYSVCQILCHDKVYKQ
jgi:hypothetical protein